MNRTVVFVPNSQMANLSLENYSVRDKFWFRHHLRVAGDTSGDRMRDVLTEMHRVLADDANVEPKSPRVRLTGLKDGMWEIEVAAYILVGQFPEFLEVQEHLLLGLLDVIERSGTAVAKGAEIIYTARKPDLDVAKRSHEVCSGASREPGDGTPLCNMQNSLVVGPGETQSKARNGWALGSDCSGRDARERTG
jgi:MscS family membrane protein